MTEVIVLLFEEHFYGYSEVTLHGVFGSISLAKAASRELEARAVVPGESGTWSFRRCTIGKTVDPYGDS